MPNVTQQQAMAAQTANGASPAPTTNVFREALWQWKERVVAALVRRGFADALHTRLAQHLRAIDANLVLDVGANDGQYARLIRRLGYRGRIVSFEPIAKNVRTLENQARRDGNWTVVPCAVGDVEGTLPINVMAENPFSSLLSPSAFAKEAFPWSTVVTSVEQVPVRRLDALLPELGIDLRQHRVHVKTDTQGYDLQALRGMGDGLASVQSLQCEVSFQAIYEGQRSWLDDVREIEAAGLRMTGLYAMARDMEQRMIEADALFRR